MADYNITKFDTTAIVVPEGAILKVGNFIDGGMSVGLVGQNTVGFGEAIAENTVQMLEHFAGTTPPAGAIRGQLWFDMASGNVAGNTGLLKAWTGADPSDVSGYNASTDSGNPLVLANWKVTGPQGITSTDIGTIGNPFVNLYVDNIFATDGEFVSLFVGNSGTGDGTNINYNTITATPNSTGDGIGIQLGTATNKFRQVHTRNAFVHNQIEIGDQSTPTLTVAIKTDTISPYTLIPGNSQTINIGSSASLAKRFGGVNTVGLDAISFTLSSVAAEGLASDFVPDTDASRDIGSSVYRFNNVFSKYATADIIYAESPGSGGTSTVGTAPNPFLAMYAVTFDGTATTAKYADLAERYESDAIYPVGTLVKVGGEKEITNTDVKYDDFIGVISEKPGFLMNKEAGPDETHPAIALTGRIPVRVIGKVKKGQRIITSDIPGVGCATDQKELCFVGFALGNKTTEEEGLVEVIVGAK